MGAEYLGGLALGAVPLIGGVAVLGHLEKRPVKTLFVRKAAKEHGTKEQVEGLAPDDSLAGKRVLVVDDVATKGGSIMQAVGAVRQAGAVVDTALVLVDREEGASQLLQQNGVRLTSVLRASDFL